MKKSPTLRLLLGLLITLGAVAGFSSYSLFQLHSLRKLQTETIDLNRHDSVLLLRVLNDVNALGLKLQEMTQRRAEVHVAEYREEFERLQADLESAIDQDAQFAPPSRRPNNQAELASSLNRFWAISDQVFKFASAGNEFRARKLASGVLSDQQIVLARKLSGMLERNNQEEERADTKVAAIYNGAEENTYVFLIAIMAAIVVTSLYLIYSNRVLFDKLESLSRQRRVLAAKLITVQEEVLRSVSRELHDEFGQILTAVSAMLSRAERKGLPPDSPFRTELSEVREITHNTLEKMRSLSQMLHPAVLDDYGLAKGIEWYASVFERQTGIPTSVSVRGELIRITGQPATHCFRIVQEALNNAAKHSRTKSAEVDMIFSTDSLTVNIRDFGRGMTPAKKGAKPGLGLIAMRERAEILSGQLHILTSPDAGTTVSLTMPLKQDDLLPEIAGNEEIGEVLIRES